MIFSPLPLIALPLVAAVLTVLLRRFGTLSALIAAIFPAVAALIAIVYPLNNPLPTPPESRAVTSLHRPEQSMLSHVQMGRPCGSMYRT